MSYDSYVDRVIGGKSVLTCFYEDLEAKKDVYIVAQALNGFTYTGKLVGIGPGPLGLGLSLYVIYEKNGKELPAELFVDALVSIQPSSLDEIKSVRALKEKQRDRR